MKKHFYGGSIVFTFYFSGEKMEKFWSKTVAIIIISYALFLPLVFQLFSLPAHAKGMFGGLLVVFATAYWGLKGGLASVAWATIVLVAEYLKSPNSSVFALALGTLIYLSIALCLGRTIDIMRRQREELEVSVAKLKKMQREIEFNEKRYKQLFDNMSSGVIILEVKDKGNNFIIRSVNRSAEKIDKISRLEVVNKDLIDVLPQAKYIGVPEVLKRVWETGKPEYFPISLYLGEHILSWREMYVYRLDTGEVVCIYDDVTEKIKAEAILKRYQTLFEHIREIMMFINKDGSIAEANIAAAKSYQYTREELLRMNILDLFAPDSQFILLERIEDSQNEGVLIEAKLQRKDRTVFDAEISLQKTTINNESKILCVIHDITERKKAVETISYLAYHDSLTGLPNRKFFRDRLEAAASQLQWNDKTLALLSLDLDNFKSINDTFGHLAGDELLKYVAERLSELVRKTDVVARMGGDEFIIMQYDVNKKEDSAALAERILKSLQHPFEFNNHKINITTSIGIAFYTKKSGNLESLFKKADIAMYSAKSRGKNNYQFYSPGMQINNVNSPNKPVAN